ncbi:hypothetical protein GCM10027592_45700 [Spirosoma flavus]
MTSPQVITIGRAINNTLVVNQPSVSKHHAKITFITDHVVLLEDTDSTFGTSVDGRRIQQTIIGPDSRVLLGLVEELDYRQILSLRLSNLTPPPPPSPAPPKRDPLDFREEFKALEKVQQIYQEAREAIQINNPKQQGRLRAGLALAPLAGLAFGPAGMIVGAVVGCVSQVLAAEFLNPSQKMIALEKEYKRSYVCPNPDCKRPLGNTPYIDLKTRKQCPSCKAKWSD